MKPAPSLSVLTVSEEKISDFDRLDIELPRRRERESNNDGLLVFAEDAAEGVGDFSDRGVGLDGGEDRGEKILRCAGEALELGEGGFGARGITLRAESVQAGDLRALDIFIDAQRGDSAFFVRDKVIYPDDDLFFRFNSPLEIISSLLDLTLDEAGFDRAKGSSHRVDLRYVVRRKRFNLAREGLDGVGAGNGIDGVGDAGFVSQDLLGTPGDERGVFRGKSQGCGESVGVQGLAAP